MLRPKNVLLVSWVERSWDDSSRKKCEVDLLGKRHPYRTVFVSFHFEGEPKNDPILWTWLQINWLRRNSTCSFPEGWLILSYLDCVQGCSAPDEPASHDTLTALSLRGGHIWASSCKIHCVPLPGGMLCKGKQLLLWNWSCLFLVLIFKIDSSEAREKKEKGRLQHYFISKLSVNIYCWINSVERDHMQSLVEVAKGKHHKSRQILARVVIIS